MSELFENNSSEEEIDLDETERYGPVSSWSRELHLSQNVIHRKLSELPFILGRDSNNLVRKCYGEFIVRKAVKNLLQNDLQRAGENGFFIEDGVRYGTINAWAKEFNTTHEIVKRWVKGCKSRKGKTANGFLSDAFYSESDVLLECTELSQILEIDEEGFVEIEEKETQKKLRYGSIPAWSKKLDIKLYMLYKCLKDANHKVGRRKFRRILIYEESVVKEIVARELNCAEKGNEKMHSQSYSFPEYQVNPKGFLVVHNQRFASVKKWQEEFKISYMAIVRRLKQQKIVPISVITKNKAQRYFFSETDVKRACDDILNAEISPSENGFIIIVTENETKRYGTISVWAKEISISRATLKKRLRNVNPILFKSKSGVENYYSETEILSTCLDRKMSLPVADESGFFLFEGTTFGSCTAWSKKLRISSSTFYKKTSHLQGISGKTMNGKIIENGFFPEEKVKEACDIQDEENPLFPIANKDGSFVQEENGQRILYGSARYWAKKRGFSTAFLTSKLASLKGVSGIQFGKLRKNFFFAESDVLDRYPNLFITFPVLDEQGFLLQETSRGLERFGSLSTWEKQFRLSNSAMQTRFTANNIVPLKARDKKNRLLNCYSEADVRILCFDLLDETLFRAEKDGFIYMPNNERAGTISSWSKELGISAPAIISRLKKGNIQPIKGKLAGGPLELFYKASDLKNLFHDVQRRPKKQHSASCSKNFYPHDS